MKDSKCLSCNCTVNECRWLKEGVQRFDWKIKERVIREDGETKTRIIVLACPNYKQPTAQRLRLAEAL